MKLGLVSLGDHLPNPTTGRRVSESERFRQLVELGVLAEQLGLDTFHVGEHHFSDYAVSSPTPILAAIGESTSSLRLSTAVSLLPHHDPVRIAEDYATVDVLSGGRVELIAGRGVFKAHYAQYGQREADGEALLTEAVGLLRRLWTEESVTWSGRIRPPLREVTVRPRPLQRPHPPVWLSASSAASVERAVALGCPIVIPTVSTGSELPAELADRFRSRWREVGRDPAGCQVGLHVHLYVGARSSEAAVREWAPYQLGYLGWVLSLVRPPGTPLPPSHAELGTPHAQAVCGNAEWVADELSRRLFAMGGADRLLVQCDQGGLPAGEVRESIGRFVHGVVPRLGAALR